jgi:hypothetical protein
MTVAILLSNHQPLTNGFRLQAWNASADGVSNAASTVAGGVRMPPVPLRVALEKHGAGLGDRSMTHTIKTKSVEDYVC